MEDVMSVNARISAFVRFLHKSDIHIISINSFRSLNIYLFYDWHKIVYM